MSTSLLALIDDIATVLDDVALMTKIATKKTAGVLGDDLALNAEQVAGVKPERELPVVWAVAKGSAINKVILVPAALALDALVPWLVTPLMMLGGAFLCFEGVEKVVHKFLHKQQNAERHEQLVQALSDEKQDIVAFEKDKVRGAIRTDFILSAEIIVISLGSLTDATPVVKALSLVAIAVLATVGIYGVVAGIVKIDDLGLALRKRSSQVAQVFATVLLRAAPILMRTLSIVGIIAVFLVGGGIIAHSVGLLKNWSAQLTAKLSSVDGVGNVLAMLGGPLFDAIVGILVGAACLALVSAGKRAVSMARAAS